MIKVFAAPNVMLAKMAGDILEQHEIGFVMRNDRLVGALGELPWTETWPEIWILDERHLEKAQELLAPFVDTGDAADAAGDWRCSQCGEESEGQFTHCWSCGSARAPFSR